MVERPAYLFLGSDELRKRERLELISKDLFPQALKDLNSAVFYADDRQFSRKDLEECLGMEPTQGAQKRLLVIRRAEHLQKVFFESLAKRLRESGLKTVVVADISEPKGHDEALKAFESVGFSLVRFKQEDMQSNAFDLARAVTAKNPKKALEILAQILSLKQRPEKILGALFWQWETSRGDKKIAPQVYERGVKLIYDADRKLKSTSSVLARERVILESLIVKLSFL